MGDTDRRQQRAQRALVAAAILGAVLPIVVAAGRAVANDWMPVWDNAYPAIRAWDVFSSDPPLVGTRSTAADIAGTDHGTHHPGPLEFYLLAPWVRLLGPAAGTSLGVAALNVACVGAVAWLAHRRGGPLTTVVAMAVMAALAWSMGSEMLFDPWPPHVTLFPFAVVLMAGWSVADRDLVAIPVLAVSASYVLQTHSGYALLVPGVCVAAVAMLVWRLVAEHRALPAEERTASRAGLVRWCGVGFVVALLCWAAPLYEQVAREGGNGTFLLETIGADLGETYSVSGAMRLFAGTIALPPWWLPPSIDSPAVSPAGRGVPLPVAIVLLVLLASALTIAGRRAHQRGNLTLASGLALSGLVAVLTVVSGAYAPVRLGLRSVSYLRFTWVAAAFVTMLLGLAVLDELRHRQWSWRRSHVMAVFTVAALAAGLSALPTADRGRTGSPRVSDGTRRLADAVVPAVEGEGTVLVEMGAELSAVSWYGPGLLAEMVSAGIPIVVRDPTLVAQLGEHRQFQRGHADWRIFVLGGDDPPLFSRAEPIARVPGRTREDAEELERLHRRLQDTIDQTGGLPVVSDPQPLVDELADLVERLDTEHLLDLIDEVRAASADTEEILDSPTLGSLLSMLDELGMAGELIDGDFPVDDLVRYIELHGLPDGPLITVWLEPLS